MIGVAKHKKIIILKGLIEIQKSKMEQRGGVIIAQNRESLFLLWFYEKKLSELQQIKRRKNG